MRKAANCNASDCYEEDRQEPMGDKADAPKINLGGFSFQPTRQAPVPVVLVIGFGFVRGKGMLE